MMVLGEVETTYKATYIQQDDLLAIFGRPCLDFLAIFGRHCLALPLNQERTFLKNLGEDKQDPILGV